jgi:hypothetical protein
LREERGAAAPLAIFVVFVILISWVAVNTFEAGYQRQLSLFHQLMAVDATRAVATGVETELNDTLTSAICAAMYDSGKEGERKEQVEARLRRYFNERISLGWKYSNFRSIQVPLSDENSLLLEWLPDGSLKAYGYLNTTFEHLRGTKAFGTKLRAGVVPRYGRMYHLAYLVYEKAKTVPDLEAFEMELNENYACEFLKFELGETVTVYELYGGRAIVEE